jgi:hypothetical protein
MTLDQHLAHLLTLMAPPFTANWKAYAWSRAKELAASDAELSELPSLLAAAVTSATTPKELSSRTPDAQPETA